MTVIFVATAVLSGEGCICKPYTSMGRIMGMTEVDPDCPLHGPALHEHEEETGIKYGKPTGKDHGPFGIGGDPELIAAFVEKFKRDNPWWEKNEPDPEIRSSKNERSE